MSARIDEAPTELDGARVLFAAILGPGVRPTGRTRHIAVGEPIEAVECLLICEEPNNGLFVYYCDAQWRVLADTWHASVADAMAQAEFEFAGVRDHWTSVA